MVHTNKLTGHRTFIDFYKKILVSEILHYGVVPDTDFPDTKAVLVGFKNGDTMYVYLSEEKFESLLEEALSLWSKINLTWNRHPQ